MTIFETIFKSLLFETITTDAKANGKNKLNNFAQKTIQ